VHCGFCTATCPTYQLLGDELDGPRGRIYLMKQVLEGEAPTRKTQLHLDRCLTCRNCESTCPSGVRYGHLVDIGRKIVDAKVPRPPGEKALRWALEGRPALAAVSARPWRWARLVRGLLPAALQGQGAAQSQDAGTWPTRTHARKVLMLAGCVQPAMMPNINSATARVLDAAGIQTVVEGNAGCCGAVKFHLNDQDGGMAQMRANIDAWWPHVQWARQRRGGHRHERVGLRRHGQGIRPHPARRPGLCRQGRAHQRAHARPERAAARSGGRCCAHGKVAARAGARWPTTRRARCSTARSCKGGVEKHLGELGFQIQCTPTNRTCAAARLAPTACSSPTSPVRCATASSATCRSLQPEVIVSANIGCITHLQSGTATPVRHWVELLDEALAQRTGLRSGMMSAAMPTFAMKTSKVRCRHRPREVVALPVVAAGGGQQVALGLRLHAFGNHLQAQFMRHHDDRLAQGQLGAPGHQVAHEGLVDLDVVDVEALQIGQ
jgi:glycolate oxidase iron-sulfur subunit